MSFINKEALNPKVKNKRIFKLLKQKYRKSSLGALNNKITKNNVLTNGNNVYN